MLFVNSTILKDVLFPFDFSFFSTSVLTFPSFWFEFSPPQFLAFTTCYCLAQALVWIELRKVLLELKFQVVYQQTTTFLNLYLSHFSEMPQMSPLGFYLFSFKLALYPMVLYTFRVVVGFFDFPGLTRFLGGSCISTMYIVHCVIACLFATLCGNERLMGFTTIFI